MTQKRKGKIKLKKRFLSILLTVLLLCAVPLVLVDTAWATESGAQILTPASGTSGTGANGGTWKCSSAGDTLTLTDYDGYPIETDAATIRFSGTNTITVPLANLSATTGACGLKLTSTKDIWVYGEKGSSLNIVFTPTSAARDVSISGIDAEGPLFINTAGDITISAPYGAPYGIRARQGLDFSGTGALDITVKGSYLTNSSHWCAAYGIAAEKGYISLSGSGSKTIRVQSSATSLQIDSTPYAICHKGGTSSAGTATISVDTGALHIEMNGYGYGIYNMGSADSAYVNINNVPELSIEKADSAIATAYAAKVNVRNSKLRITNGRYAIQTPSGTVTMENAEVTAAVRGSNIRSSDAAVYAGTLQVKGGSTVDMTATYGTVVYAGAVSVNLSSGSFTAKTGQSNWPPISAPVTLGAKTRLVTGVCSDADAGTYAGELVDASDNIYETRFASVISGSCGENLTWTLTPDGVLTISGTGAMDGYRVSYLSDGVVYSTGTPWEAYRSSIKSIIIKSGVTSIGMGVFAGCSNLTSVAIPSSVTSIGSFSFYYSMGLASVTIPSGVTSIGNSAFAYCSGLTNVTIPDSVTSIGNSSFAYCSGLTNVTIPDSVTSIGNSSFAYCIGLTSVSIPASVTSIGNKAFSGCSSLTDVYYGGSMMDWVAADGNISGIVSANTTIHYKDDLYGRGSCGENVEWVMTLDGTLTISGTGAMKDYEASSAPWYGACSQVKKVIIGDGVTRIGDYAFQHCRALTGVTIPSSVTAVGDSAFYYCTSLAPVTIPDSVTSIGNSSFAYCIGLTSVSIPASVTSIGNEAFSGCTSLTSVSIPASVTSIGNEAFSDCSSLTDVYYGGSMMDWVAADGNISGIVSANTTIHFKDDLYDKGNCGENVEWALTLDGTLTISGTGAMTDYYNSGATPWHSVCSQIKSVIIEDGVTRIGNYAFSYCDALAGVTTPDSVTTIGDQAFKDCKALTSMAIPGSVTMIGDWAFDGCGALTDIYYGGYGIDWLSASGNYCGIPSGTTVHFKSGYGKGSCGDNVSWVLPLDGTLTISGTGEMADYDIDNAPWYSFRSQVKSVVIEDGVTRIGISAFKNCDALTDVTIPNGVSSIGEYAFSDCSSLTSVTIPNSVTSIGSSAFDGCGALKDVYYGGYGMDWLEVYGHDQIPDSATVHYKEDLYGRGSCGENVEWVMTLDGTLTISGTGAMADYEWNGTPWASARSEIKSVVIGDGVTRIGDYAFQHCRALTGAAIPASVTAIGDSAFYYCTSLASVTIPGGVTTIGDRAFAYCKTLTGVTIPDGVTGIDSYAFAWCSALTSAAIPGSVSDIGAYAFYECGALTDVYYGGYGMDWLAACDGSIVVPGGTTVHFKDDLYGSGSCGISTQWVMDSDGTLTISGTGRISNYDPRHETSLAPAPWYAVRDYVQSVVIEDGITGIGNYAFYGCEELTSVTIPDGVTDIGDAAFGDCTSLTGVVIPAGVTAIRNKTFYGCVSLTSITLPQGMTSIGGSAFSDCISLTSVAIPDSVTRVEAGAFEGCTSLTDMTLPKSLTRLGGGAFRDCTSLTGTTVPEGVDCIYGSTFANCTSLTSVTLPSTVNWIGDNAFFNCVRLSSVTIPKRVCYIYQDAFRSCDSLADVYYGGTTADWAKIVMEDGNGDLTHATLHCTAPAAPAAPVVTAGNSAVSGKPMLTWNAVEGATSYKVYRAAKEDGTYGLLGSTSATSYTNTGAKEGVTYYYKVTAVNDIGESEPSNIVSGQVKTVTPKPAAPVVSIGHSAASGKPQLTWSAVTGAASYNVYRATAENGSYSLLGSVTVTNYTNTGAKEGVTYYYKVTAVNDSGEGEYSNIVSGQAKSVTPKPSAPVVKIGNSATSGKPMLTWNAVSGATSYTVYRAASQNGTYSLLGTVTATSYTNTGAKAGTTYWYKVKAVNSAGESAYSNIVSGRATVTTLTMGHSSTSGKPMLTWKAVSGAASYKVYRATAKNGAYSVINTTKALTYTNTGAALGTTYYYKVEALNASGKSMGFSAVVEGKVAPVLAVGYSSVSGKPQLTWKSVPGATEYQVYRSTQQNSGYTKINTTTATSYVNTGAKANTTYYYRIVAVKGTAVSDFSNIVTARPSK